MADITQKQVSDALNIAVNENGCIELFKYSAVELAWDLIMFDSDFEQCEPEELEPFCVEWLKQQNGVKVA